MGPGHLCPGAGSAPRKAASSATSLAGRLPLALRVGRLRSAGFLPLGVLPAGQRGPHIQSSLPWIRMTPGPIAFGAQALLAESSEEKRRLAPRAARPHLVRHFLLLPRPARPARGGGSAARGGGEPSAGSFPRRLHPGAGEAQGHPGAFLGTGEGRPLSGLPRSPWAKGRGSAEFKSRSWCRLPAARAGGDSLDPAPAQGGPGGPSRAPRLRAPGRTRRGGRAEVGRGRDTGLGSARGRPGPAGVRRPPQVPGYRGPRAGGGRRGRAGVPVRSPARPSVRPAGLRRSVRGRGGGGGGRHRKYPRHPHPVPRPPPARPRAPRPGPRRRHSRQPRARWA